MKKPLLSLTLLIATILAIPTVMSAQEAAKEGQRRGPRSPEEQVKAMKESLQLTDEQADKVKAVFAKNQEKVKALREDTALSQEDRRTKMRELYQGINEEIKPILTPEQQTKWKEEQDKRRANRPNQ